MKYWFETDLEVGDCYDCPLHDEEFGKCNLNSYCITVKQNCYHELKPKQLVWEEYQKPLDEPDRVARYKSGIYNIIHKKAFDECCVQIYWNNVVGFYPDTVEEAKKWCQDHYNKLFNEMIGGVE